MRLHVSTSTQNQALAAILFLSRKHRACFEAQAPAGRAVT